MQIALSDLAKYFVWGAVVFLLQTVLAPLLEIRSVRPDLLLIFVMVVTLTRGRYAGLAAGFLTGIAQDSISLGFLGVMALIKCSIGFWTGTWLEGRDTVLSPFGWLIVIIIAAFLQDILAGLFLLHGSYVNMLEYLLSRVIPASFYTGVFGFLWFLTPLGKRKYTQQLQSRKKPSLR